MRSRRRFLRVVSSAAALASLASARRVWAGPAVEIEVDLARNKVAVEQQAMVSVKVTTHDGSSPQSPTFRAVDGLHVQAVRTGFSSSSSFSFGTGRVTTTRKSEDFRFVVWADKPGEYPIEATIQTRAGTFEPLDVPVLEVVAGGPLAAMPGGGVGQGQVPAGNSPGSPLPAGTEVGAPFIVTKLVQDEIWLGESFQYRSEKWAPLQRGGRDFAFQIDNQGDLPAATKVSLPLAKKRRERVEGVLYEVEELTNVLVTPQRAGTLDVPGLSGSAQLVERVFFDLRALAQPVKVQGETKQLVVKPLPAAGQPPNFRPFNVGRLQIKTSVDRTKVPEGEGLTLTVTISGRGNLALIEPDAWPELDPQLRRYDPEVGEPQRQFKKDGLWGKRSWSFLLIPDGGGRFTIPEHTLHYFDPVKGEYAVAESKAIEIQVEGAAAAPATGAESSTGAKAKPAAKDPKRALDEDAPLAPIRGGDSLPRRAGGEESGEGLGASTWSWLAGLVPAAFVTTWLGERAWARFGPDDSARALAERHKASLAQLDVAAGLVSSGEGFWALMGELLQRSAVERLGPEAQGLTRGALAERLLAADIPEDEVQSWRQLLDRADAARYGAGGGDASARQSAYDEAAKLVQAKHWRPRG